MKKIVMICVLGFAFLISGCSTIYFHNGATTSATEISEWHHDGIARLVEFSDPVDLNQRCENKEWQTVKVEKTFIQGLASVLAYGLYDPWAVDYVCKK